MPDTTTEAAVIAELAGRARQAQLVDPNDVLLSYVVNSDGHPSLVEVEQYSTNPRRATARRRVADVASLLAYLQRHDPLPRPLDTQHRAPDGTPQRPSDSDVYDPYARPVTLWADETSRSVTAVLNDHQQDVPGWGDHTATLTLRHDPDWTRWLARSGVLMSQEEAAEFLEDLLHTVVDPDAADLLEVVSSLQVHRQMVVGQTVTLRSGATQITYSDEDTATAGRGAGTLEVPSRFTVRCPVYIGGEPTTFTARFRYRQSGRALKVGGEPTTFTARFRYRQSGRALKVAYLIDRQADAERAAFAAVVAEVTSTGRHVLFGSPRGT